MPSSSDTRDVDHSAALMFDLVSDVERYPEFVPLCEALHVQQRDQEESRTVLVADMTISYKIFRDTFTTRVVLDPDARSVTVDYLDGPFHHLESRWNFEDTEPGRCRVHFFIDYEFKSPLLAGLMGGAFSSAFAKFSESFVARADQVYGTAGATTG